MKNRLLAILALFLPAMVSAQTDTLVQVKRKTEISFSVSFQSITVGEGRSSTTILLVPRIGFYVYRGLQIEPEGVVILSSEDPTYMMNGNLVYNFVGGKKAVPFLLAGYGVTNTVPVHNIPIVDLNITIGVLNLGAGIKAFIADNIALRGEYRYQKFSGEEKTQSLYGYSYTQSMDARIHSFQFGIVIVP